MKFLLAAALTMGTLALSGCTATVSLDPAADANNPACADVVVRLPDSIDALDKRQTNSQSTAAWGEPTGVIFRCGLPPVTVSKLTCVTTSDIDWLVDDSNKPSYRFVTFARTPAIEVIVDSTKVSGVTALDELASAVGHIPASARCAG
ncbi:MAG: hypothetical protein RL612_398 [Actinomycetota bacterium]|jgi:hypothetical protein